MKKTRSLMFVRWLFLLAALCCLGVSISSCSDGDSPALSAPSLDSQWNAFYQNMVKANSHDGVFSRHTNFFQTVEFKRGAEIAQVGTEGSRMEFYAERDCFYTGSAVSAADNASFEDSLYTKAGMYSHERKDGSNQWYADWYIMTESEKSDYLIDTEQISVLVDGRAQGEKIISVTDNGNGTVTVTTAMPIQNAPQLENGVPAAWKGATLEFVSLLDATTLELKEGISTVLTNGERIPFDRQVFSYDAQKTERCASLLAFADKVEKKDFTPTRTITAYYNYGTAKEEKFEYALDDSFSVMGCGRDGYLSYEDLEGTKRLERIDPSKKAVTVYLLNQQDLQNAWDKLYEKIMEENTREKIFSRHTSFSGAEIPGEGVKTAQYVIGDKGNTFYVDRNFNYEETDYASVDDKVDSERHLWTPSGEWMQKLNKDGSKKLLLSCYAMSESERSVLLKNTVVFDGQRAPQEKIASVTTNDDGSKTMIIMEPIDGYMSRAGKSVPAEWKNAYLETACILDATTLDLKKAVFVVISKEGKRIPFFTRTYSYDEQKPEGYSILQDFATKVQQDSFTPTKTVTLYYNYGTEKQETYVYKRDDSFALQFAVRNGYIGYKDPEGKEVITGRFEDGEGDVTVYLLNQQDLQNIWNELYGKVLAANSFTGMFPRYNNFSITEVFEEGAKLTDYGSGQEIAKGYAERGYFYCENVFPKNADISAIDVLHTESGEWWRLRHTGGTEELIALWFIMPESEKANYIKSIESMVEMSDGRADGETVTSVAYNGDGTITMTTTVPLDKAPIAGDCSFPAEWNGACCETIYVFDASTLEIKRGFIKVVTQNKKIPFVTYEYGHNVAKPERCDSLMAFKDKVEKKEFEPTKKITAYYNYGTAQQETYEYVSDGSFAITPVCRDGYDLYDDAAGTIPFSGLSGKDDVTIYVIKKSE